MLRNPFIWGFLFVFMNLKKITFASLMFLSSIAFSQDKLHFDLYSKGEGFFNPRLKIGYIEKDSNEMNFSFFRKMYQMSFSKLNDSTYREMISIKIPWKSRKEIFDYSFKDSCYVLDNYSAVKGKARTERDSLEGTVFDKKYRTLLDLFNDFENDLLKDSIHFITLAVPYSIKVEKTKEGNNLIYSSDPGEIIKEEPGDFIIFPYPIKAYAKKNGKKIRPYEFSTRYKKARTGRSSRFKGILRED